MRKIGKISLLGLFALTSLYLPCSSQAQIYFPDEVDYITGDIKTQVNFKNCKDAGYLRDAYAREDNWHVRLYTGDDSTVFNKSYDGTRLDALKSTKTFTKKNIKIHPGIPYYFALREDDWGLFGDDEIYKLEEFDPGYEFDEDLTCLTTAKGCGGKKVSFTHVVGGKDGSTKNFCIKSTFSFVLK